MRVVSPSPVRRSASLVARLTEVARANPDGRWRAGTDIASARNAHLTNTPAQLRAALAGPFDWLECDVRLRGAELVASHDARAVGTLALGDWVRIAAASGRGMKFDVKERRALGALLRLARQAQLDEAKLIVNVRAGDGATARAIRAALPRCTVNLDPGPGPYSRATLDRIARIAREIGGPVMVPLDARFASSAAIRRALRAGRVAIWNAPARFDPGPVDAATRRLRALGVDGMVDLRRPTLARVR